LPVDDNPSLLNVSGVSVNVNTVGQCHENASCHHASDHTARAGRSAATSSAKGGEEFDLVDIVVVNAFNSNSMRRGRR
jgi:hypothetical protein